MGVVILNDKSEEVVEDIFRKILTSQFKQDLHGIEVPLMSSGEAFCQFCYLNDEVVAEVIVGGTVEGVEHLGDDDLDVVLSSHSKKKFKGLALQSLVFAL